MTASASSSDGSLHDEFLDDSGPPIPTSSDESIADDMLVEDVEQPSSAAAATPLGTGLDPNAAGPLLTERVPDVRCHTLGDELGKHSATWVHCLHGLI